VKGSQGIEDVRKLMERGVSEGVFPGGVALWGDRERIRGEVAAGFLRTTPPQPGPAVTPETLYDLASLTKPLVTGSLLLRTVALGRLDLSMTVASLLPEAAGTFAGGATLSELLSHSAGLCAWAPLYERVSPTLALEDRKRELFRLILDLPPAAPRGEKSLYSDFGFMLLGWILEQVWNAPLDRLYREIIAGPLKVAGADFLTSGSPLGEAVREGRIPVASTETDPGTGLPLTGVVHDEHARLLGGVSGHAGLFGSARAVWELARPWLGGGFFPEPWLRLFRSRKEGLEWALGWDTPTPGSSSGRFMTPEASIGHLGYAGTSLWIDWRMERIVVLLTNRVHPVRTNNRIREFRPRFHDTVLARFGGSGEREPQGGVEAFPS
jgi:CubicO group peptidase (beta-lactamase class C family)